MVSDAAQRKIYSRCPQRSSSHSVMQWRSISRAASAFLAVYSSTSERLQARMRKKRRIQLSHHRGSRYERVHLLGTAQNFQCILQEGRPGISSERAVRWAFGRRRGTSMGCLGGVSCLPSPGQHCGHPSCRLVPSWQQDLSLCGPLPLTGIETGLVALIGPCHLLAAPVPAFAPDGAQGFPGDGRAVAGPRFFSRPRRDSHPSQSASAPNLADELSGRAPVPRKPALFALGGGSASKLIKGYSYLRAG